MSVVIDNDGEYNLLFDGEEPISIHFASEIVHRWRRFYFDRYRFGLNSGRKVFQE